MKKSLVLAVLAAATAAPAFAQSSVTIYGRLNVTAERVKVTGQDVDYQIRDNASRLGFKGVEDLGGGLKAGFILEHRFDATTGVANAQSDGSAGAFWGGAGQTEVNMSGNWGMVRLGRFFTEAYYATADYVSLHNHDTGLSSDALYVGYNNFENKVAYRTPMFGGLWAEAGASEMDATGYRSYDGAVNYDAGPLHLGLGYTKKGEAQQVAVRALYEAGAFTFGGYYQRNEDSSDYYNGSTVAGTRNNFRLSGMYTMGATELHLNFGMAGDIGGLDDSDAKQFTVGINQNLSKRTKIYGYYTRLDQGVNAPYADFNSFALGVRHNF